MRGLEEAMIYQTAEQAFLSRGISNIYVLIGCTHFSLLRRTNCKWRYWSNHSFQYPWNMVLSIFSFDAFQLYGISMFSKHFAERTRWLMAVPQHFEQWRYAVCQTCLQLHLTEPGPGDVCHCRGNTSFMSENKFFFSKHVYKYSIQCCFLHHYFTWSWIPHGHEAFNRLVPVLWKKQPLLGDFFWFVESDLLF